MPVGTEVAENDITSYDTLGMLVDTYNKVAREKGFTEIDRSLVDIRDAFAHGKVSVAAEDTAEDFRLIKFSPPVKGL